jgi:uncharacterized protein (TIGR03435 family)
MVQGNAQWLRGGSSQSRSGHTGPLFSVLYLLLVFGSAAPSGAQDPSAAAVVPDADTLEAVSIKPSRPDDVGRKIRTSADRITIENLSLKELIVYAYHLKDNSQVLSGPDWLERLHFDIAGVASEAEAANLRAMTADDQRKAWGVILQSILAERFQLKVVQGIQTLPVYALVVAKSGAKLKPASASDKGQNTGWDNGRLTWTATSMEDLAYYLTRIEGRVVLDQTGLTRRYDFTVGWASDGDTSSDAYAADLLAALREQLGLDLKSAKEPVEVVVVQSAKQPELD